MERIILSVSTDHWQMPRSLPTHTYHDYEFLEGIGDLTSPILAIKLAEPLAYPAPSVSMQYSSTPNEGVTNEMIEYEFGRNPGTPRELIDHSIFIA